MDKKTKKGKKEKGGSRKSARERQRDGKKKTDKGKRNKEKGAKKEKRKKKEKKKRDKGDKKKKQKPLTAQEKKVSEIKQKLDPGKAKQSTRKDTAKKKKPEKVEKEVSKLPPPPPPPPPREIPAAASEEPRITKKGRKLFTRRKVIVSTKEESKKEKKRTLQPLPNYLNVTEEELMKALNLTPKDLKKKGLGVKGRSFKTLMKSAKAANEWELLKSLGASDDNARALLNKARSRGGGEAKVVAEMVRNGVMTEPMADFSAQTGDDEKLESIIYESEWTSDFCAKTKRNVPTQTVKDSESQTVYYYDVAVQTVAEAATQTVKVREFSGQTVPEFKHLIPPKGSVSDIKGDLFKLKDEEYHPPFLPEDKRFTVCLCKVKAYCDVHATEISEEPFKELEYDFGVEPRKIVSLREATELSSLMATAKTKRAEEETKQKVVEGQTSGENLRFVQSSTGEVVVEEFQKSSKAELEAFELVPAMVPKAADIPVLSDGGRLQKIYHSTPRLMPKKT